MYTVTLFGERVCIDANLIERILQYTGQQGTTHPNTVNSEIYSI